MQTSDYIRLALPALLGLPVLAAILLRFMDGSRARSLAIAAAVVHLVLTLAIIAAGLTEVQEDPRPNREIKQQDRHLERVFAPQFVPGDPMPGGKPSYSTGWDVLPIYGTAASAEPGGSARRVKLGAAQFFIGL